MYADIIVDISQEQLDKTFQYRVPPELETQIDVGMLVSVPFGRSNRVITGYVIELGETPKFEPSKIKPVEGIVPDRVQAVSRMIRLAAWLRHHYGATMNQALKTVLPVKEKIQQRERRVLRLIRTKEEAFTAAAAFEKKHAVARARLLKALAEQEELDFEIIKSKLNITMQTVRTLEQMGFIELKTEALYRNPIRGNAVANPPVKLNDPQRQIVDGFCADYDCGVRKTYLLHGVTGSGKTLCYMEMIAHVLSKGLQVIMLIPEIALTYQTVRQFYSRFGDAVSIMNSRMSKGERYDQFLRAMRGEISIMIGPRSALFTPFSQIGLIVIDEEHEGAYKSEQVPRYHARETAIHIAGTCNASVVLGSATPSVEAYYRALRGEYELCRLSGRAAGSALPTVYTEDLREELKQGNRSIFSRRLQALLSDRLDHHEQSMLFLNKRGYAGFISCRACGHVLKCPHCDLSLTAHRNGRLVCHYCGYAQPQATLCPKCGSRYISGFRAGTQQVEEQIKKRFPAAVTLRMDMDTTAGKEGHERILSAFANHEADILIGTQMIVKGHDFPDVTLVGILAADLSLYAGDYRAAERTFQLLTQAAGRAGRGKRPGEVVIQTYTPDNYSITAASRQDYEGFYQEEIAFRELMGYPPVCNLLKISFAAKNESNLDRACARLQEELLPALKSGLQITGPVQAGVYKLKDTFHQVMYVKSAGYADLTDCKERVEQYVRGSAYFTQISLQFDFN